MNKSEDPMKILVVGGGSAGWITANLLNANLAKSSNSEHYKITLVESPSIPAIGVGEATVPSIRRTLQTIGIPEQAFMKATQATFKNAIRFSEWNLGVTFDHPFDRRQRPETDQQVSQWLVSNTTGFDKQFSLLSNLCDEGLAPKAPNWPDYASTFPYAYHLDAVLLAKLLCDWGVQQGIEHRLADISHANLAADGSIASVTTAQGEPIEADLFIDCTGFRAKLISEALGVQNQSYSQYLLCDRAVTFRIPYEVHRPSSIRPYTQATARRCGWTWDINLRHRRGLGYVYSSQFITADEAERELRQIEGAHTDGLSANHIRFASQKRQESWFANCIAVGLADGFLEPLESSGLYMIEFAGHALSELIPDYRHHPDNTRKHFNRLMDSLYAEVLTFVNLHYVASQRRDTEFWRAATEPSAVAPDLVDRLAMWRTRAPTELDFLATQRLFSLESHEYLLFGMDFTKVNNARGAREGDGASQMADMLAKCRGKLPGHEQWLSMIR